MTSDAYFERYDLKDLYTPRPGPMHIIRGLAYPGHITLIGSWMGVGKTTLINAAIAGLIDQKSVMDFLEIAPFNGDIVIFTELAKRAMSRTMQGLENIYDVGYEQALGQIRVHGTDGQCVLHDDVADEFRFNCKEAAVVFIDGFDQWSGVPANRTDEVRDAYIILRSILTDDRAVVVLDHQGKTAIGQDQRMTAVAGASAKQRQPELVYLLDRVEEGNYNLLTPVKDRFGDAVTLELRFNEDGRLVAKEPAEVAAHTLKETQARTFILGYLSRHPRSRLDAILTAGELAGHARATLRRALDKLVADNKVQKPERGIYGLKSTDDPAPLTHGEQSEQRADFPRPYAANEMLTFAHGSDRMSKGEQTDFPDADREAGPFAHFAHENEPQAANGCDEADELRAWLDSGVLNGIATPLQVDRGRMISNLPLAARKALQDLNGQGQARLVASDHIRSIVTAIRPHIAPSA